MLKKEKQEIILKRLDAILLQRIDKQAQLVQHCESTQKRVVHEGMDGDFRTRRISKFAMTLNLRSAWGKCKNAFI